MPVTEANDLIFMHVKKANVHVPARKTQKNRAA